MPPTTHEPFPTFSSTLPVLPPSPLREGYYGSVLFNDIQPTHLPYLEASTFELTGSAQLIRSPNRGVNPSDIPRRSGRGLMVYSDRTMYEGDWVDDERHGHGICYFPSGNIYIGSFAHGHMEGPGSMLYHDGDFFTGSFRQSVCHGIGVFYSGGTEVRGEWRNGVRVAVQKRRGTSMEDFDAQRLHYESFRAVLGQLHGHFVYYSLFDNRFQRSTINDPTSDGIKEPLRPESVLPKESLHLSSEDKKTIHDTIPAVDVDQEDASSSAPTYQSQPQSPGSTGFAPLSTGKYGRGSHHHASFSIDADIDNANIQAIVNVKRRLSSPPQLPLVAPESTLLDPQRRRYRNKSLDHTFNSPTKNTSHPREPIPPLFATTNANHAQSIMASPHLSQQATAFPQPAIGVVQLALDHPPHRSGELASLRMTNARVLFASAGPMVNEHFAFGEYVRYVISFLLPVLSIPHIPWCPLIMTGLEVEREFVVSGAALSHDFTPPKGAVYVALTGFLVHLVAIIIAGATTGSTASIGNTVQHIELIAPAVAWLIFAFVCAGYHGYFRVAHALERLDRRLAPKLAAFAASVIDASADICVFTWDEEGRSKITNPHYKYRWLFYSFIVGSACALAVPVTRSSFGKEAFLSSHDSASVVVALSFIAMFLFSSGITFYVLKITDMQRQVTSQLQVLTKLAFLGGVSMTAPSEHRNIKFDFDAPLDLSEVFCGFVGWWVHRNFILAASACSNHFARATSLTAVIFGQLLICLVVIGDVAYAGASGQLRLGGPGSDQSPGQIYFTGAHGLALVWVPLGGFLVVRYLIACVATQDELKAHLSIMNVASLYHNIQPSSTKRPPSEGNNNNNTDSIHDVVCIAGGTLIRSCCTTAAEHDPCPTIASIPVNNFGVVLLSAVFVLAFSVLWVLFADAVNKN